MKTRYFDNYQMTPLSENVKGVIKKELDENFLPSLKFIEQGAKAREKVHIAKEYIAKSIGAKPEEIFFGKEGTTIDNHIVRGVVEYHLQNGRNLEDIELIVDSISCPDIYAMHKYFEKKGVKIHYIGVDEKGNFDIEEFKSKLNERTIMVSITHFNQIIGTIQQIDEIARITKEYSRDIMVNIEAQLSYFKTEINLENIDFLVMSAYKIHGPLISAYYKNKEAKILPILHGRGMSAFEIGFPNIAYISGFSQAVEDKLKTWREDIEYIRKIRDYAWNKIISEVPDSVVFGPGKDENRDPANLLVSFKYIEGESVYMDLSFSDIIVNTTSACAHENLRADYVILGIGKKHEDSHGSLRITFSKNNTKEDVDMLVKELKKSVDRIRSMSAFRPEEYSYEKIKEKNKKKCEKCDAKKSCEVHK